MYNPAYMHEQTDGQINDPETQVIHNLVMMQSMYLFTKYDDCMQSQILSMCSQTPVCCNESVHSPLGVWGQLRIVKFQLEIVHFGASLGCI